MSDLAPVPPAPMEEAAPRSAAAEDLHVVFRVADAEYALPANVVVQMESFTEATTVPSTAPFLAGIMPLRGRVVPVIDLRLRFGLSKVAPTLDSRVVVGELGDRVVALLADSAREVVKIPPADLQTPPRLVAYGAGAFVKAIAQVGKRMILVLDFAKVIGEEPDDAG
jgi:purine-binding chemotaxis protein CheW